jgi:hypothetical protein
MVTPETGQQPDYALEPDHMTKAIEWYLTPVIERLSQITGGFTAAHAEVKTAHDQETAGWFAGVGNGDVRMASSSFLNAAEWQLRQLMQDQNELSQSLQDYRAMLQEHVKLAGQRDQKIADRFTAIDRQLGEMGH